MATATDEGFLTGTLVLLSSFLAHNPRFDGDIVIIHTALSDAARAQLSAFPSVRLQAVGDALRERLAALCAGVPELAGRAARFHSLEAFALPYERVLFLDSDILCTGDASAAFGHDAALAAVPDLSYWQGQVRHVDTFVGIDERFAPDPADTLLAFNAGVLAIRPSRIGADGYRAMLALLDPASWNVRTGHTDQAVLNRYFRDTWARLPDTFNVLLTPRPLTFTRQPPPIDDAVFLHFLARPKPWELPAPLPTENPTRRAIATMRWHSAWDAYRAQTITTPAS